MPISQQDLDRQFDFKDRAPAEIAKHTAVHDAAKAFAAAVVANTFDESHQRQIIGRILEAVGMSDALIQREA